AGLVNRGVHHLEQVARIESPVRHVACEVASGLRCTGDDRGRDTVTCRITDQGEHLSIREVVEPPPVTTALTRRLEVAGDLNVWPVGEVLCWHEEILDGAGDLELLLQ